MGIVQTAKDNGVLILVAPSDRQVRIEVGYGLEGVLPDNLAGDIIRNQAIPASRDGKYERGLRDTVERVASIVLTNHTLTAEERAAFDSSNDRPPSLVTTPFNAKLWVILPIAAGMFALGWVKGGSDFWRESMRGGGETPVGGIRGKGASRSSGTSSRRDSSWTGVQGRRLRRQGPQGQADRVRRALSAADVREAVWGQWWAGRRPERFQSGRI